MAIQTLNPTIGKIEKTFKALTQKQVKARLAKAQKAFESWSQLSHRQRAQYFKRVAYELRRNDKKYARIITREMGMPITSSIASVNKCAWNCEYFAQHSEKLLKAEIIKSDASQSYVRFDPLGVVLLVMPWNYPFWQVFRQAVTNIMAGNTVVLKHASNVPQSALAIERIFRVVGFPLGVFQTLLIGSDKVEQILNDWRVKGVSLTGSVPAGSSVAAIAGREIKRSVMELGGSDPFIVLKDADISHACSVSVQSRMVNTGQSCIAAKRFIVVKEIHDKFIKLQKKRFEALIVGNPMEATTQVGPLSSAKARQEIQRQVRGSIRQGAKLITGGKKIAGPGFFFEPTILANVKPGMPGYEEEVFGPVASVIKALDMEDAIRIANDTKYGLGASIWTENIENAQKMAARINSGNVFINGLVKSDPRLPFGGVNYGGYGRELSRYGLLEFVNVKTVWVK